MKSKNQPAIHLSRRMRSKRLVRLLAWGIISVLATGCARSVPPASKLIPQIAVQDFIEDVPLGLSPILKQELQTLLVKPLTKQPKSKSIFRDTIIAGTITSHLSIPPDSDTQSSESYILNLNVRVQIKNANGAPLWHTVVNQTQVVHPTQAKSASLYERGKFSAETLTLIAKKLARNIHADLMVLQIQRGS